MSIFISKILFLFWSGEEIFNSISRSAKLSSINFFTRPIQNFPDFYKPVGPGVLEILRNKQTISKYFSAIYDIYVFKYICKITAIYDIYIYLQNSYEENIHNENYLF